MTHNTLHSRKGNPYPREERSQADQIAWECWVVDHLEKEVEHFNPTLKNFQLRLEIEW
jgi:hypothetical protein